MKYYILDLSKENSLVRFLTAAGHTVFIVSWRNPTAADADLGMEDYLEQGVFQTIAAVKALAGDIPLHLVGYCLGGTLAAIGAAALKRRDGDAVKTLTLLAAQVDFSEAGELSVFISDSQLAFLEALMKEQGVLEKDQMTGAFQVLRSNDLLWSRALKSYWMGERETPSDLMAWNADGTRMPCRMHSEYLRGLYLNNDFASGRFQVGGEAVSVSDIRAPIFAVATTRDHVAPWRSVYKLHLLADTDVTFLLTEGGHNGGVLSEPGHAGRSFRMGRTRHGGHYRRPDRWAAEATTHDGSWWPEWSDWLKRHAPTMVDARTPHLAPCAGNLQSTLSEAPGTYVHQK